MFSYRKMIVNDKTTKIIYKFKNLLMMNTDTLLKFQGWSFIRISMQLIVFV